MKSDDASPKRRKPKKTAKRGDWRWILIVSLSTLVISAMFSFFSSQILNTAAIWAAFLVLLCIVAIGIVFDILGVAVTAADVKPFHGMASRKVKGAADAIQLLRNASRVSSFCNDVIGDICGVVSGAAAAVIAAKAVAELSSGWRMLLPLTLSALVAAATVGGKAVGKSLAIRESTQIVFFAAKCIRFFRDIPMQLRRLFQKKKA